MSYFNAEGQTYHSFRITKHLPLNELKSTLIEAVHEPSGARIMHIANDDPENLFCLSFQTLPSSSNGVAHILEHTVLCGSTKFPIKDPFFSMTRRSLNTYMNALTGQDFTCYPASSAIKKDFYNILDVYLDAVFHPELKEMSFLQEGHRLEFAEPKNPKSPLQFQGVVYNEMKGALSAIDSRLWEVVLEHLTPDLPYAFNSGGNPKDIPSLSYEELKEFHQTFYHPSRCLFFFYGNIPLSQHLDFLEAHTLNSAKKVAPLKPLPLQKRFTSPVSITASYPIAASESLEKKTWIVFSWLTAPLIHQEEVLALCLLESLLMDTDASPLKIALLQSKLCSSAESSIDIEMSEVPLSFICKGCDAKDAPKIKKLIFDTLQTCSFSLEQIQASLHQLEFDRTEINADANPFGLTLFFRSGLIKQHGSQSENALLIHTLFRDLQEHLKDPEFLPNLLRKHLLENPHYVELIFTPDPTLEEKERQQETLALQKIAPYVNPEELVKQSEMLAAYQESIETQSLDCLPKLALSDIPEKTRTLPLSESKKGALQIFHHNCFTNKILYADLVYDLPHIPKEDLFLVSLYSRFVTELGFGGRNYVQNLEYQQAHTGELSASLSLHIRKQQPHPTLSFKGKCLERNSKELLSLFTDLSKGADCQDLPRIQELLQQHATELQNRLNKSAIAYAIQTSLKGFSKASFIQDEWQGFSYYQKVLELAKKPEKLGEEFQRIQEMVLAKGAPQLILSCQQEQYENLLGKDLFHFSSNPLVPWKGDYQTPPNPSSVHFITSPVAFTARGMHTVSFSDPRSPLLLLATELLDNCHLHQAVREKGGAYGSGASYSPQTGNFHLYSYRDPHLAKTLDEFQKALEKISAGKFSKGELEEAIFGVIQTLDTPISPGNRAMTAYAWKRAERTDAERQAFRKAILKASKDEIVKAVKELLLPQEGTIVSFLGENLFQKESKKPSCNEIKFSV